MRIALVCYRAERNRGGTEQYMLGLAESLARAGHDVSFIAAHGEIDHPGVQLIRLPARGWTRASQLRSWMIALDRHLASTPYDLVHSAMPVPRCDVYHVHAGLAAHAVATGHHKYQGLARSWAWLANQWNRRRQDLAQLERWLLNGPDCPLVISLSQQQQAILREYYQLPATKMAVLSNAIDLERFDPARCSAAGIEQRRAWGFATTDRVAVHITQNFQLKGVDTALKALAQVRDQRAKLVVVGRAELDPWRKMAAELQVADRVVFAGPSQTPERCYAAADLVVFPTRQDTCGLVILEGIAMGRPVITTAAAGASEVLRDGEEGYVLADPEDDQALAAAWTRLLDDRQREQFAAACLQNRGRLSHDTHLAQLLRLYAQARPHSVEARAA